MISRLLVGLLAAGLALIPATAHAPSPEPGAAGRAAPSTHPGPAPDVHERSEAVAQIPPGRSPVRVPILMYHYIREADPRDRLGFGLSVRPPDLAAQLDWLVAHGYRSVTMADVDDYLDGRNPLPERAVVLTFDDGYADFYTAALPALEARRLRSVAYIVPALLGGPGYMSAEQVAELPRHGVEVASHSLTHPDLTTAAADLARLRREVVESRQQLERLVGQPVLDFCYPSGRVSPAVEQAVREAGYRSATTTAYGLEHTAARRLQLARVRVSGGESLAEFARLLGA